MLLVWVPWRYVYWRPRILPASSRRGRVRGSEAAAHLPARAGGVGPVLVDGRAPRADAVRYACDDVDRAPDDGGAAGRSRRDLPERGPGPAAHMAVSQDRRDVGGHALARNGHEGVHARGFATRAPSVQLTGEAVSVKARTSNGGIDVDLTGTPAQARLDIYVSYELEVNVDASLTPAIDDLNTDGPIGVRCEIISQP